MSEVEVNMASQDAGSACQHGRTDVRTYEDPTCVTNRLTSGTRAGGAKTNDVLSLSDVIGAGFWRTTERHPVVRTGDRDPIPYHVRAAIWLRDFGKCQRCSARGFKQWELDHIIPWSAGGSDASENLRVLCAPCNQERSNFQEHDTTPRRPVTWWCHRCYVDPIRWDYDAEGVRCYRRHRGGCTVERVYGWQIGRGETPTWHKRLPIEAFSSNAFCAHCLLPGLTDRTL